MKQPIAKSEREALDWIDTQPHYEGAWSRDSRFLTLSGPNGRLRIHANLMSIVTPSIESAGLASSNLYKLNERGRRRLDTLKAREVSGVDPHKPRPYKRKPANAI